MCRMLLTIGKFSDLSPYMDFLVQMADEGKGAPHHDGFGYVLYTKNETIALKSIEPAKKVPDLYGTALIAHARKISSSTKSIVNTQPFTHGDLSFAHNGTIKGLEKRGTSDSFNFFKMIIKDLPSAVSTVRDMKFTSLNFIITDGRYAAAYREVKTEPGYYSLFYKIEEDRFTISTEEMSGKWYEILNKTLIVYRNGRINEYDASDIFPSVI
ncbi:MAG: class II glutamine amidotransferase [Thermoplasmatales archaeon]